MTTNVRKACVKQNCPPICLFQCTVHKFNFSLCLHTENRQSSRFVILLLKDSFSYSLGEHFPHGEYLLPPKATAPKRERTSLHGHF